MRDHQHGQAAVAVELGQALQDLPGGAAVQVAGGLVGQQNLGIVGQGPGDGHALLLSAGEFPGAVGGSLAESHVVQELRLSPGHLDQVVEVHATQGPFPATIGWHPWFRRTLANGSRARLEFHADGMLVRDEAGIPGGEVVDVPPGPWDDCFTGVRWPVVITWGESLRLEISSDVSFAVVYDERAEAFCVEPQSGPPNGPNTQPVDVRPGAPLTATTRWAWG